MNMMDQSEVLLSTINNHFLSLEEMISKLRFVEVIDWKYIKLLIESTFIVRSGTTNKRDVSLHCLDI